jgi:endoglucanase
MLLTRYAQIATTQDKKQSYLVRLPLRSPKVFLITPFQDFALSQLNYALGNNSMSGASSMPRSNVTQRPSHHHARFTAAPYIVGSNPNSPVNPHSALASGGDDINHIDTSPPQEAYVLYGAVVGGPDQKDRFYDIRSDWPETEVRVMAIFISSSCTPMRLMPAHPNM